MIKFSYLAPIVLALAIGAVQCTDDLDVDEIYKTLFEPSEASPISAEKARELLVRAQAYYLVRGVQEGEQAQVDLINSYVEAGEIRADKCTSSEFKKLNMLLITGLYKLKDEEHFGVNDLPKVFHDSLHYTNALDYLKVQRTRQVKECNQQLKEGRKEAVAKINNKVRKELTDERKDFTDSLYRIVKDLILGAKKSGGGLKEYSELFKKEIGTACTTITGEMEPLMELLQLIKSEINNGELPLSETFTNWIDRSKTCRNILDTMDDIIENSYKIYADDKSSGKSLMGKMMGKFGKKSRLESNH